MAHRLPYRSPAGGRIFKSLQRELSINRQRRTCLRKFFLKKAYKDQDHSRKLRAQKLTRNEIHPRVEREGFPVNQNMRGSIFQEGLGWFQFGRDSRRDWDD